MNSTLYNGYSGIRTHQFGLDSVSNNIANINTTGYRANMPEFKSIFANALNSTNINSPVSSDMNYGSTAASNAISSSDGSYKESEGELDVAYAGKGWFVVGDNENLALDVTAVSKNAFYTRDGSFSRDAEGYIVNSGGYYMLGVDLEKIENGVFRGNPDGDYEKLATTELKPLRIPQDLHYGPSQSTKVEIALNLNKNQSILPAYELMSDGNNGVDTQKLLNQDISSMIVDNEILNTAVYSDVVIKINDGNATSEYVFTYGAERENGFKTIGELQKLIKDSSGLDLDFARLPDGSIDKNLILELKNNNLSNLRVELGGKLFEKLGLKGERDLELLKISDFNHNKAYKANDYAKIDGVVFKKIEADSKNSPLDIGEDNESGWEIVDSTNAKNFDGTKSYELDSIVKFDGKIYQKIQNENQAESSQNTENLENNANTNLNPSEDSASWRELGDEKKLEIATFNGGENYDKNSIVSFNNQLYRKISDAETNKEPNKDNMNWQVISTDGFSGNGVMIANYKTSTEFYDENGNKLLILSNFIADSNSLDSQKWRVTSAVYDKDGNAILGDEVEHSIEFDKEGKIIGDSEPIVLKYGEKEISYNVAKSNDKDTTNFAYVDSAVTNSHKDGSPKGELVNISVDNNGIINLAFSNGITEPMGRFGIAAFVNDQGLSKVGDNLLQISSYLANGEESVVSTGAPLVGWDENGALRFGQVLHKYLETSNVNPADAMTDLIVLQRGYAMNAKAFTTGDDLIKEAINLKR